jgi:hypothetical protein
MKHKTKKIMWQVASMKRSGIEEIEPTEILAALAALRLAMAEIIALCFLRPAI